MIMAEKFTEEKNLEVFENQRKELDITGTINIDSTSGNQLLTTIDPNDEVAMFNAMGDADYKVNDYIGKSVMLAGYLIHDVEIVDKNTGELQRCPRCVLIDTEGKTYGCVSWGIFRSLERLVKSKQNMGPWPEGVNIEIVQTQRNGNSSLGFKRI